MSRVWQPSPLSQLLILFTHTGELLYLLFMWNSCRRLKCILSFQFILYFLFMVIHYLPAAFHSEIQNTIQVTHLISIYSWTHWQCKNFFYIYLLHRVTKFQFNRFMRVCVLVFQFVVKCAHKEMKSNFIRELHSNLLSNDFSYCVSLSRS